MLERRERGVGGKESKYELESGDVSMSEAESVPGERGEGEEGFGRGGESGVESNVDALSGDEVMVEADADALTSTVCVCVCVCLWVCVFLLFVTCLIYVCTLCRSIYSEH
jgi:hypothetical protein